MSSMYTARDSANGLGRVALAEHAAVIIHTIEAQGKIDDEQLLKDFGKLRTLVGPLHHKDFHKLAKSIWSRLDKSLLSNYMKYHSKESLKVIKGIYGEKKSVKKQDHFDQLWVEATLLPPTEDQWISDKELWGWLDQFKADQAFTSLILEGVYAHGVEKTLEDLGRGVTAEELIHKIETLDLTMSELRLLQLITDLLVKFELKELTVPENPDFELPKGAEDE